MTDAAVAPGLRNIGVGGTVFCVGLLVTVATASAAGGGGKFVVAWGAIAFGGIQFVVGLVQYLSAPAPRGPPVPLSLELLAGGTRTVIDAMASVVHKRDAPTSAEVAAINTELVRAINGTLSVADIRQLIPSSNDDSLLPKLVAGRASINKTDKEAILRGCFSVMTADGANAYALPVTTDIGKALGLSAVQVTDVLGQQVRRLDGNTNRVTLALDRNEARQGKRLQFNYQTLITCAACKGMGCDTCSEVGRVPVVRTLTVTLPPGLKSGDELRYENQGESPVPGGIAGDLIVTISVAVA